MADDEIRPIPSDTTIANPAIDNASIVVRSAVLFAITVLLLHAFIIIRAHSLGIVVGSHGRACQSNLSPVSSNCAARQVARADSLNTGDPKITIKIVPTDKPIAGVLNKMDYSPGLDFRRYGRVGEGVTRYGGNRGHINSDEFDSAGNSRNPEGALLHDTLHMAGFEEGYEGGDGDGRGGRTSSTPAPGLTKDNIMTARGGNSLTPEQTSIARGNESSKQCTAPSTGSIIMSCK